MFRILQSGTRAGRLRRKKRDQAQSPQLPVLTFLSCGPANLNCALTDRPTKHRQAAIQNLGEHAKKQNKTKGLPVNFFFSQVRVDDITLAEKGLRLHRPCCQLRGFVSLPCSKLLSQGDVRLDLAAELDNTDSDITSSAGACLPSSSSRTMWLLLTDLLIALGPVYMSHRA